jgi:hypothetical protein
MTIQQVEDLGEPVEDITQSMVAEIEVGQPLAAEVPRQWPTRLPDTGGAETLVVPARDPRARSPRTPDTPAMAHRLPLHPYRPAKRTEPDRQISTR